ncbi:MAG: hypothetical protein IIA17_07580 [candidate division Zixibacteria bacterium]|nr:hypothetical protein [candidate division Zixibacteria bacterium]
MKLKKMIVLPILLILAIVLGGCSDDEILIINEIPAAPQGVFSITGDNAVYIFWNAPYEADLDEFFVYRSFEPVNNFVVIGTVIADDNPNLDLVLHQFTDNTAVNGQTYYYAVASVDFAGQVSELSAEDVFDTPRPEGSIILVEMATQPTLAGLDLSAQSRINWNDPNADVYLDTVAGIFYINATDTLTDLQDMGYTESFDDIGYAPTTGWSENGWAEVIPGHTYVIWTRDFHYAKLRASTIGSDFVDFQWAYQLDQDNPELVGGNNITQKPDHGSDYLRRPNGDNVSINSGK